MHLRATQLRLLYVHAITSHTDLNSVGVQKQPKYQVQRNYCQFPFLVSFDLMVVLHLHCSCCLYLCVFRHMPLVNGTSVMSSAGRDYAIRGTLSMSELRLPALNHQWGKSRCCRGKTWKASTFCSLGCIMTPLAIAIQGWTPETPVVD